MTADQRPTPTPLDPGTLLTRLAAKILAARPKHRAFLEGALAALRPDEIAEAERYLHYLLSSIDLDSLRDAYLTILDDTFEAQLNFQRSGRYQHSSFAEVANSVYFNAPYMRRYMIGLALTMFYWTNHIEIRRFFMRTYPVQRPGRYLEIGPGHGFFLLTAIETGASDSYLGVDISAASIALTRDVVESVLPDKRHLLELRQADFLSETALAGPFEIVVMGEVLEHVENPLAFLRRLRALAAGDAHVFVTTCVNTPAIDHIYLFREEAEVAAMIDAAGFDIVESLFVPRPGYSLEKCVRSALPINLAYVLKPRA